MSVPEEIEPDPELARLIGEFAACDGALDYLFFRSEPDDSPEALHRSVALAGMAAIARLVERGAIALLPAQYPPTPVVRVTWDDTRLTGEPIDSDTFLATSGYTEAFFYPPYGLSQHRTSQEYQQLFAQINTFILGPDPRACEIFSWGTDWSNYFDAGKEWWGAFYWTLRQPGSDIFTVIGASSTD